jgi:hypothetical protein
MPCTPLDLQEDVRAEFHALSSEIVSQDSPSQEQEPGSHLLPYIRILGAISPCVSLISPVVAG